MAKIKSQFFWVATAIISGVFLLSQSALGQGVYDPSKDKVTGTDPIPTTTPGVITNPDPIAQINAEIEAKKRQIDQLRQQTSDYQQQINKSLQTVQTYESQVAILNNQIALTSLDIQAKETEIQNFELEMSAIQISIDQKTTAINDRKQSLSAAIKQLDENSRVSTLALVISNNSLAEFYSQAEATASISDSLQQSVSSLNSLRDQLQAKQDELTQARDDVALAKQELQAKQEGEVQQKIFKDSLVNSAERSYGQYQQLYQGSLDSEEAANSTIAALQNDLQRQLSGVKDDLPTPSGFTWPLRGPINAYFLDPSYVKTFSRQHYGIDIGAEQGTPVRAPADGKVGKIIDPLAGSLSVLQIQHGGGFVTYYLHLSKIFVSPEQSVKHGDVIGLSGGTPGTAGAGPNRFYSTGPHLHFEVWKQNSAGSQYQPEDPLKYLP